MYMYNDTGRLRVAGGGGGEGGPRCAAEGGVRIVASRPCTIAAKDAFLCSFRGFQMLRSAPALRHRSDPHSPRSKHIFLAEMWSSSEEGSYLRRINFCMTPL